MARATNLELQAVRGILVYRLAGLEWASTLLYNTIKYCGAGDNL